MQYYLIFLLTFAVLVVVTRPLTVLLHELGHAIPALLLTKQKVTIYIGSNGDPKRGLKMNVGLLIIFFRYNPLAWKMGLCVPSAATASIKRQIIYTITGPLASLVVAGIACYVTFAYDLHGFLKLFFIAFLISACIDLLVNLIPNPTPFQLYNGTLAYNDGYMLKQLFYYLRLPKKYMEAINLYNQRQYANAATLFQQLLTNSIQDENIYRLAINASLQEKNYTSAKELSDAFAGTGKMNAEDFSNRALAYSWLGLHNEAMEFYDRSLQQNPDNIYSLNNKGYTLNLLHRFEEAIAVFDKVIAQDEGFAYAYNNRGLSKIKLGRLEDGLHDINYSFKLDRDNAYAYRNLGIYHFDRGEFDTALLLFIRAEQIDGATHMIKELIQEAKDEIDKSRAAH